MRISNRIFCEVFALAQAGAQAIIANEANVFSLLDTPVYDDVMAAWSVTLAVFIPMPGARALALLV